MDQEVLTVQLDPTVPSRLESASDPTMHLLKLIFLPLIQLVKQAWSLPESVATAVRQRQRQIDLSQRETERLDRIRHPSKYLGK